MSGRIKEGNTPVSDLDYRGTYMLGDTARLTACDIGISYRIKQRGLTVVYVTHYAYDRISELKSALVLLVLFQELGDNIHLYFLLAEDIVLDSYLLSLFVAKLSIGRNHLACEEELLNYDAWLHLELFCKLLDGKCLRQHYLLDLVLGSFLLGLRLDKCALACLGRLDVQIVYKLILAILGAVIPT